MAGRSFGVPDGLKSGRVEALARSSASWFARLACRAARPQWASLACSVHWSGRGGMGRIGGARLPSPLADGRRFRAR